MKQPKRKSDCPINFALEIFGDRWTLLVVRDLMFKGRHYFGEFVLSGAKIASNTLADRLAILEHAGIVVPSPDPHHKQKIRYRLTQKGIDLVPALVELILWSAKYDAHSAVDQAFVSAAEQDREGLVAEIKNRLSQELKDA
jgi:DNA-binding HxlR family transcriptional regulator